MGDEVLGGESEGRRFLPALISAGFSALICAIVKLAKLIEQGRRRSTGTLSLLW
jgi:hypothetical protein